MAAIDDQRQEPGAKRIAPGLYQLAELLNPTKQANLFRSLRSASTQMRYNPSSVLPATESLPIAGSKQSSVWKTPRVVDPDELLPPCRILKRHQIEQLVLLNTWKNDDLSIPFEWVNICDKAADLVHDILSPFFPALIHSNMYFTNDQTRFRSDAKLPGWRVWVSLGCKANVAVHAGAKTLNLEMFSGDALVMNTSPRYNFDIAVMAIQLGTCPPSLTNIDVRLQNGRCNLILAEDARHDTVRDKERLLRRTFEIHRKKLWKKQAPFVQ